MKRVVPFSWPWGRAASPDRSLPAKVTASPPDLTHSPAGTQPYWMSPRSGFWSERRPLVSRQVVVNLIGSTTTREGLRIKAGIDENTYAKGIKVTDKELAALAIERDEFHGEWNYRLLPRNEHA